MRDLYGHARDSRLHFVSNTHTYYVDGVETLGSVTGLVHAFAGDFDAARVSAAMIEGRIPV